MEYPPHPHSHPKRQKQKFPHEIKQDPVDDYGNKPQPESRVSHNRSCRRHRRLPGLLARGGVDRTCGGIDNGCGRTAQVGLHCGSSGNWLAARRTKNRAFWNACSAFRTIHRISVTHHAGLHTAWLRIVANTQPAGQHPNQPLNLPGLISCHHFSHIAYFAPANLHSISSSNSSEGTHANSSHARRENSSRIILGGSALCWRLRRRAEPLRPAENHSPCRRTQMESRRHRRRQAESHRGH